MPFYYHKPENALKRADEFVELGRMEEALDSLSAVLRSRRHRTWQLVHESIATTYLALCVQLGRVHAAKEGLYHYRNLCQGVNVKSLEDVVVAFLQLAKARAEEARERSSQVTLLLDDLDQEAGPAEDLLSAVSGEDGQDRTERAVLAPWIKFLWESYRISLDMLRNNASLERVYHEVAQDAFRFCLDFNRKAELRKLCNNLRIHLGHIHKRQLHVTAAGQHSQESQAMHLKTGITHLESAVQLELWQEAFRAIEDIHGIINMSKTPLNPRLMANYYEKLSLVFWKASDLLFHAAALFRFFSLTRDQKKNITSEEMSTLASRVVLATLSIPVAAPRPELLVETDESVIDKNHLRLSALLGLPCRPSRRLLIEELVALNVLQCVPTHIQGLCRALEFDFLPLTTGSVAAEAFRFISTWTICPEASQYVPRIRDVTVMKLLTQLSKVYRTITFNRFFSLLPEIDPLYLETLVAELTRRHDLSLRIDHVHHCLHFEMGLIDFPIKSDGKAPLLGLVPQETDGKMLEKMYATLVKAANVIHGDQAKQMRNPNKDRLIRTCIFMRSLDHRRVLSRRRIIEERKEMLESERSRKEEEERRLRQQQQRELEAAEKLRLLRDAEERNAQRQLREESELRRRILLQKAELLLGGRRAAGDEQLDPDLLISRHLEQLSREKSELAARLVRQERAVDHLERAKRAEELPRLLAAAAGRCSEAARDWDRREREAVEAARRRHADDLATRERARLIGPGLAAFADRVRASARAGARRAQLREFRRMLAEQRGRRLAERAAARKRARRDGWLADRAAARRASEQLEERSGRTTTTLPSETRARDENERRLNASRAYENRDGFLAAELSRNPTEKLSENKVDRDLYELSFVRYKEISILRRENNHARPDSRYGRESERLGPERSFSYPREEARPRVAEPAKNNTIQSAGDWRAKSTEIAPTGTVYHRDTTLFRESIGTVTTEPADHAIEGSEAIDTAASWRRTSEDQSRTRRNSQNDERERDPASSAGTVSRTPQDGDRPTLYKGPRDGGGESRQRDPKTRNSSWRGEEVPWREPQPDLSWRRELEHDWRFGMPWGRPRRQDDRNRSWRQEDPALPAPRTEGERPDRAPVGPPEPDLPRDQKSVVRASCFLPSSDASGARAPFYCSSSDSNSDSQVASPARRSSHASKDAKDGDELFFSDG